MPQRRTVGSYTGTCRSHAQNAVATLRTGRRVATVAHKVYKHVVKHWKKSSYKNKIKVQTLPDNISLGNVTESIIKSGKKGPPRKAMTSSLVSANTISCL